jgi:putative hydrolase of the HAD superfamily
MPLPYPGAPDTADSPPRIEVILFDYGMVLSAPPDPAAWARMRGISGLDEDRLHAAYWAFRHDYDRGALTAPEYWEAVAQHAGLALDTAQIDALLAADLDLWTQPNPPMIAWAGRLQRAGARTAILSNIGDAMAEGLVARLPWLAGFERCIWSYALSLAKPDPAIFVKTAEMLHTAPVGILFIDDKEENVAAAAALGIQAIQYTDYAEFEQEMRERSFTSLLDASLGARDSRAQTSEDEPASARAWPNPRSCRPR